MARATTVTRCSSASLQFRIGTKLAILDKRSDGLPTNSGDHRSAHGLHQAVCASHLQDSVDPLSMKQIEASTMTRTAQGRLFLIMGPMFAGKSTCLMRIIRLAEAANDTVLVITSAVDTRNGSNAKVLSTHNDDRRSAIAVRALSDLRSDAKLRSLYVQSSVVCIDESQFFPDLFDFCVTAVEHHSKVVYAAGLHGDFQRDPFGDLVKLMPHADSVKFLTARCSFCDSPAPFTLRVVSNEEQVLVGGGDSYRPVCREHYHALHMCAQTDVNSGR